MLSFGNAGHKSDTAVSSYLWELKKKISEVPKTSLTILKIVLGYSKISKQENKWSTENNIDNIENSPRVFKDFEKILMPTQKNVYFHLLPSRGVIEQTIGTNIKMPSWEQISFSQL